MNIEIDDVIIDNRVTTVSVRITPKLKTRKKFKLDPFYQVDKYIPEKGKISYTVFDMFGNILNPKEADKIIELVKDKI